MNRQDGDVGWLKVEFGRNHAVTRNVFYIAECLITLAI